MKKHALIVSAFAVGAMWIGGCAELPEAKTAAPTPSLFESPNASAIIAKDLLAPATKHTMPQGCVSNNPETIKLGKILFNDYSNKNHKFKEFPDGKDFGNCVACHNVEKGVGYGNVGPDLSAYRKNFVESGVRNHEWIYQKIADPRIDNPNTQMTINKTNGLLNEQEVCQVMSYLLADK